MTTVFDFSAGRIPLLISIPHDGRDLAPGMYEKMHDSARALPDTDWHVRQLYEFARGFGASIIAARFSRYVVDLNRSADDATLYEGQVSTGLCPAKTFAGDDLYRSGKPVPVTEQIDRVERYWRPYHEKLSRELEELRDRFGYALLWDAHSIASQVPLLFPGTLPDLNLGTFDGRSCAAALAGAVQQAGKATKYQCVLNERFRGGYITRQYGAPDRDIHAIQLELSQRNYMDEKNLRYDVRCAAELAAVVKSMLAAFVFAAKKRLDDEGRG